MKQRSIYIPVWRTVWTGTKQRSLVHPLSILDTNSAKPRTATPNLNARHAVTGRSAGLLQWALHFEQTWQQQTWQRAVLEKADPIDSCLWLMPYNQPHPPGRTESQRLQHWDALTARWGHWLFGIFAHALHRGQGASALDSATDCTDSHNACALARCLDNYQTLRGARGVSASGLAEESYPALQHGVPRLCWHWFRVEGNLRNTTCDMETATWSWNVEWSWWWKRLMMLATGRPRIQKGQTAHKLMMLASFPDGLDPLRPWKASHFSDCSKCIGRVCAFAQMHYRQHEFWIADSFLKRFRISTRNRRSQASIGKVPTWGSMRNEQCTLANVALQAL